MLFLFFRSIVWLQSIQDAHTERSRVHLTRYRLDTQDFRIGRLKHERVTVPRGEEVCDKKITTKHLFIYFISPQFEYFSLHKKCLHR